MFLVWKGPKARPFRLPQIVYGAAQILLNAPNKMHSKHKNKARAGSAAAVQPRSARFFYTFFREVLEMSS